MIQRLVIAPASVGQLTVPEGARYAAVTVEGTIRFYYDGSTPTTTYGHLSVDGTFLELKGSEISFFRAFSSAGAVLQVTFR